MDTKRMNFVYFLSDCIIMGLCYILTWYIVRKYFFVYVWTVETGNSFRIFYLISLGLIPYIYAYMHCTVFIIQALLRTIGMDCLLSVKQTL